MLKQGKNGVDYEYWDYTLKKYVKTKIEATRGKGTKAYTLRRINMLEDKLKELKKDLQAGKYDKK